MPHPLAPDRPRRASTLLSLALLAACHAPERPGAHAPTSEPATPAGSTWLPAPAGPAHTTPAIALTASDGTGLRLVGLRARAWVEAPLALTELHLEFENPGDRTLEGRFAIQLPPRSAVSRFAMKIGDLWQEGEVVERQEARRVFEDFLHRRQDPALLEHDAGERFSARVFPIPAHARKQLILTYSQELAGAHADYRLPIAGLPQLDTLDLAILGPDPRDPRASVELYRARDSMVARPDAPALREVDGPPDLGLRSGDLALARITIPGASTPAGPPAAVTLLLDTSASQAPQFAAHVARLTALIERLGAVHGATLPLRVWAFDQEALELFRGPAGDFSARHADSILRRRALGASDLARALAAIRPGVRPGERIVLLGDGVITAGAHEGRALTRSLAALRGAGVVRIDAVLTGANHDLATLTRLTTPDTSADTTAGALVDGTLPITAIVDRLRRPGLATLRVSVPGSRWTWPERLDGVQPGDTALIYADLPAELPLAVELAGHAHPQLTTRAVERPLLERAWVGARIHRLLAVRDHLPAGDEDMRRSMRDQVVELSRRYRVLSPFTGLLVLESEADYQRYGIRRDALAQILAVGDAGPELLRRDGGALHITHTRSAGAPALAADPSARPGDAPSDGDGDGLGDSDDRCPTVPETRNGYQDEDGCPDEVPTQLAMFTGSIRGIYFADGSAKISAKARPVLDRTVQILREFSTIALEISGHRLRGEAANLGLQRAAAVRDYLVHHGIDRARLILRDAGADEPVDREITRAGRARNRRIEYTIRVDSAWTLSSTSPGKSTTTEPAPIPALRGKFATIMAALPHDPREALLLASAWCDAEPGDVLAHLALGEALTALGDKRAAARAYGSLIDLDPGRAELRRHAAERLAGLGAAGLALAIDSHARAVATRPDHLTGHRLYAHALARAGRHADALAAILAGLRQGSSRPRAGVLEVLRADAGLLAAALVASAPERRAEALAALQTHGLELPLEPSTHVVLGWETDASDLDLHIIDGAGERASYQHPALSSGGALVADVTNGYGPEMFTIPGPARAYPYTIEAQYFAQGPTGYGLGTAQILEHDGKGGLRVEARSFVIMNPGARVSLGRFDRPQP